MTQSWLSLSACLVGQTGQRDLQGWGSLAPYPHMKNLIKENDKNNPIILFRVIYCPRVYGCL